MGEVTIGISVTPFCFVVTSAMSMTQSKLGFPLMIIWSTKLCVEKWKISVNHMFTVTDDKEKQKILSSKKLDIGNVCIGKCWHF